MSFPHFKQSHHVRLFLSLLLLLVSGALIVAHRNREDVLVETVVLAQGQSPQAPFQAELITTTPAGFEPTEITRPHGRFLLAIDNRSGLEERDVETGLDYFGARHYVNSQGRFTSIDPLY
jgi:hypothetical protein